MGIASRHPATRRIAGGVRPWVALAALATLAAWAAVRPASACGAKETWYRISIDGVDAGWQGTSESADPRGMRSSSESLLRVGRDGAVTEIRIRWEMLESAEGTPIHCTVEQWVGAEPTRTRADFAADGVVVRTDGGGRELVQRLAALPAGCLGPAASGRYLEAQRAAGRARISCTTIDPASGLGPVGIVTVPAPGERCWSTTTTLVQTATIECLDEQGDVVRAESRLGIGTFVLTRADRARAQAPLPGGAAVDVLRRSVVEVRPVADALLSARRAVVSVRARAGTLPPLPSSGAQRVEGAADASSARVTVDSAIGSPATDAESADPRYRDPSPVIDCSDPAIRDAAQRTLAAVREEGDQARAEALRAFVHRHIAGKDLASVFACASAVMRDRRGDCTEHAVLLAAMLRAAGIPSRLAAGVVYAREFAGVRGCYAWHMWTQALVGGQWRDLDATLSDRPFHAGHILVATGAQEGPSIDPVFAGMVMTVGNLAIDVESVDGSEVRKAQSP